MTLCHALFSYSIESGFKNSWVNDQRMSDRLIATGLTVRFNGCSDAGAARERLRNLRLSINEIYSGVVQLIVDADGGFGEDSINFPAALGIRVDRYDYTKHGNDSVPRPADSPEAWELALDVINGVNILVDDATMIYRSKHLGISKLREIDIKDTDGFGVNHVNEHITIHGETLASQFDEPPNWVEGKAGTNYYIGTIEYDTRDFGGTDPDTSVEAVASDLVEQALTDLLPVDIANRVSDDELLVQLRIPESLTREMENVIEWQDSINKSDMGSLGPPGIRINVIWENGLGFIPIEKIDYSYANIDIFE